MPAVITVIYEGIGEMSSENMSVGKFAEKNHA